MKDCNGNKLKIGDEVVYIQGKNSGANLNTGKITKFYKGRFEKMNVVLEVKLIS